MAKTVRTTSDTSQNDGKVIKIAWKLFAVLISDDVRYKDIRRVSQRIMEFPECGEMKLIHKQYVSGSLSPPPQEPRY